MDIDCVCVGFGPVDLVTELEGDNRIVAALDSVVVLVEEVPQAVAVALLGVAGQGLIAGYVHQMCYQSFWHQQQLMKFSPHWIGSGLKKMTLFAQAEAWLILSGSLQVLACLLGSVQTCGPAVGNINKLISCGKWHAEGIVLKIIAYNQEMITVKHVSGGYLSLHKSYKLSTTTYQVEVGKKRLDNLQ